MRAIVAVGLTLVVFLSCAAARAEEKEARAKLSYFGGVAIRDGELILMDGGIHGVQGHTLAVAPDGAGRWERRVDSFRPSGKPGAGTFKPDKDELARARAAADRLWVAAEKKSARSFFAPLGHGPPRWVWAIVLRRGDEVRALEGGAVTRTDGAPEDARVLLQWMIDRVDELQKTAK